MFGVAVFGAAVAAGFQLGGERAAPPPPLAREEQIRRLAQAERQLGKAPVEAIRLTRPILDDMEYGAAARAMEGRALADLHLWSQSEARLARALDLNPADTSTQQLLIQMLWIQRRYVALEDYIRKLLAANETTRSTVPLLLGFARSEHERPDPGFTFRMVEPVVSAEPGNARAALALAAAMVPLGRPREGLESLEAAAAKLPDDVDAWRETLDALIQSGKAERALALAAKLPASTAEHPEILRMRAVATEGTGDAAGAEALLRRSLAKAPRSWLSLRLHVSLLERLGRKDDLTAAKATFAQADEARRTQAEIFVTATSVADVEVCRKFAATYRTIGEPKVAERWEREATMAPPALAIRISGS
jgi:tetratricopeptide (TPR) repeat protein